MSTLMLSFKCQKNQDYRRFCEIILKTLDFGNKNSLNRKTNTSIYPTGTLLIKKNGHSGQISEFQSTKTNVIFIHQLR